MRERKGGCVGVVTRSIGGDKGSKVCYECEGGKVAEVEHLKGGEK